MNVLVAGRGDEDIHIIDHVFDGHDFETVHAGLQGTDRVDLGDVDAGAGACAAILPSPCRHRHSRDEGFLAGHHDVGAAANGIDQAFAAAIAVVEFRLGDAVIHIDRREGQLAALLHLVKTHDAGRGFFRYALDGSFGLGKPARRCRDALLDLREQIAVSSSDFGWSRMDGSILGLLAEDQIERRIAAIVEDHVGGFAIRPGGRSASA